MARISYVKHARASAKPRSCMRCGHEVQVGEAYKHVSLKTGPYSSMTRVWCNAHQPRQSELTANDRKSRLYAAQETLEDALQQFRAGSMSLDDLKQEFEMQADEIEAVADEYEESADNLPENLQYSSQADEMRDNASNIREWAESVRGVDWPEFDPDECIECQGSEDDLQHDESDEENYDHDFSAQSPEDADLSSAEDAVGECPL